MADERIEVEWIATAQQMVATLNKMDARFEKQEATLKKLADTSKKTAEGAAGSFNKLEAELKQNEAALNKLQVGTKEFGEQKKKVDALRASLQQAKTQLNASAGGISTLFSAGIGKLAQLAAGMAAFQQVVSMVVDELEKTKSLRLDAAASRRTFEEALADIGQNIGGGQVANARQMILTQAPQLGTTNEGLANLLGVAISAGAKDLKDAMSLSAAALKLTVGNADKAQALVGGTLDVASLGGSTNYRGALGQLLQTQSQVRSTNLSEFSANIGPGLAAATADLSHQKGVSTERALEMSSVISQIIKDQTGSNTATTMRMLFTRMGSFVPEASKKLDDGGTARVTQEQIKAFNSLTTFDERLKMMQDVPAIGKQFLETQRESIGKTAISEIISRSARAVAFEDKAKAAIESIDKAQSFFENLSGVIDSETAVLTAERRSQSNLTKAQVESIRSVEGQALKIFEDTIPKVNLSGLDKDTATSLRNSIRLGDLRGADAVQTIIEALQQAQEQRKAFNVLPIGGQVSAEDRAVLQKQIDVLQQLQKTLDAANRPKPAVPPVARPKEAPLPAATVP